MECINSFFDFCLIDRVLLVLIAIGIFLLGYTFKEIWGKKN